MKKHNILYGLSIIILIVAFFLISEYPNWNRANFIAGVLVFIGFSMNLLAFKLKN